MIGIQSRKEKMLSMRFDDLMTLQEIGNKFGITKERVRQIIGNTGHFICDDRNDKIIHSKKCNEELAEIHNLDPRTISLIRDGSVRHDISGGPAKFGYEVENYVHNKLLENGIPSKAMPFHSSFDILAYDNIKIDVKGTNTDLPTNKHVKSPQWRFNIALDTRGKYCDYFVCVIWKSKDCFVIPIDKIETMRPHLIFCWPTKRPEIGKYQKYHNRWDLIIDEYLRTQHEPEQAEQLELMEMI